MNVLSLFDGMACGRLALERAGLIVTNYYASEVDKYAIIVAKRNWPDIVHIGDVCKVRVVDLPFITDLLIGGSPCQGLSLAGKRLNFNDPRSKLFWEYHRIYKECLAINPNIKFMLENVCMDKDSEGVITDAMGVQPILINSALVSAQNRERLYWTNIGPGYTDLVGTRISEIPQPKDRRILLKDIIEDGIVDRNKSYCIDANYAKGEQRELSHEGKAHGYNKGGFRKVKKFPTLRSCTSENYLVESMSIRNKSRTVRGGGRNSSPGSRQEWDNVYDSEIEYRKLIVTECERLQTVPDGYTSGVSNSQRYKMLGNGWNVETIVHIFGYLK
jgi:DNA-cytosine methyltransferase